MAKLTGFGSYFKALREMGLPSYMIFYQKEGEKITERHLEHDEYDGITGIPFLHKQHSPNTPLFTPVFRSRKRPSFITCFAAYREFIRFLPYHPASWKLSSSKNSSGNSIFLAPEQTEKVIERAKANKVSVNAWLLAALNKAVTPYLEGGERIWMLPVSIHQQVPSGNGTTFLDVRMSASESADETENKIRAALSENLHWGIWLGMELSALFGVRALKKLIPKIHSKTKRTGIFSNLGHWKGPLPTTQGWVAVAPGYEHIPFAAGALTWGNTLGLAIQLHSSIAGELNTQEILERWLKEI